MALLVGARAGAGVARVGIGGLLLVACLSVPAVVVGHFVVCADVADVDGSLRDLVVRVSPEPTSVDGVRVVGASAGRVDFHDLVTHDEVGDRRKLLFPCEYVCVCVSVYRSNQGL